MIDKDDEVIRTEVQEVQLNWTTGTEKTIVAFLNNEEAKSHFGKVTVKAKVDTEERMKSDQKK